MKENPTLYSPCHGKEVIWLTREESPLNRDNIVECSACGTIFFVVKAEIENKND